MLVVDAFLLFFFNPLKGFTLYNRKSALEWKVNYVITQIHSQLAVVLALLITHWFGQQTTSLFLGLFGQDKAWWIRWKVTSERHYKEAKPLQMCETARSLTSPSLCLLRTELKGLPSCDQFSELESNDREEWIIHFIPQRSWILESD